MNRQPDGERTYLFVYGGLMRGFDLNHYLACARFCGRAWASGKLVAVDRYPGMIDGEGTVAGELYELGDGSVELEALDDLEDFDPANPEGSRYIRAQRTIRREDGSSHGAWLYLYNRDVATMPVVKSGDWRQQG